MCVYIYICIHTHIHTHVNIVNFQILKIAASALVLCLSSIPCTHPNLNPEPKFEIPAPDTLNPKDCCSCVEEHPFGSTNLAFWYWTSAKGFQKHMSSERVRVSGLSTLGLQGFGVQGLRVPLLGPWFTKKPSDRKTRTRAGWKWTGRDMR